MAGGAAGPLAVVVVLILVVIAYPIAWTDPPSGDGGLVHDLDLEAESEKLRSFIEEQFSGWASKQAALLHDMMKSSLQSSAGEPWTT
ncbi:hypothetical protein AK812_SmicGene19520 [Symbiodinium microadriaticum]|uniref:Uncharacterized protein n=1 Tax=Symbiodinium microadriaticum TaxID=2951 RepID=A0A1Q9DSC2_SYMMI|nr:hypothetical protein AK812_SmicGene19520 [Symbiodinium microadriaticum]